VKKLKKVMMMLVTAPAWLPVLLFMMFYVLIVDVNKVHKEYDDD
jgi:hypothetical protein